MPPRHVEKWQSTNSPTPPPILQWQTKEQEENLPPHGNHKRHRPKTQTNPPIPHAPLEENSRVVPWPHRNKPNHLEPEWRRWEWEWERERVTKSWRDPQELAESHIPLQNKPDNILRRVSWEKRIHQDWCKRCPIPPKCRSPNCTTRPGRKDWGIRWRAARPPN